MPSSRLRKVFGILREPRRGWPELRLAIPRGAAAAPAADGAAPSMRNLVLAVNGSCDQACPVCDIGSKTDSFVTRRLGGGEALTPEDCERLAADLTCWKPVVALHDAEPLAHPGWQALIRPFAKRGFFVSMTTSGTRLTESAEALVACGLHHLEVSADAGEAGAYARARGKPDLAVLEKGLTALAGAKTRAGTAYPRVSLNAVLSPITAPHLEALGDLCGRTGAEVLTFTNAFHVSGTLAQRHNQAFPAWPVTPSRTGGMGVFDAPAALEALETIRRRHPSLVLARSPTLDAEGLARYAGTEEALPGYARCRVAWGGAQVLPGGDVVVNLTCFSPVLGNIRRGRMTEIWNAEAFRAFRRALLAGLPPACLRCGGLYCG